MNSLLKSISLISSMTFFSRILGFLRDLIAAQIFGVNANVDAFYMAFKIPNFMRSIFAEGAFSQALMPVLLDYQKKSNKLEFLEFVNCIFGFLIIILLIVTFFGVWKADYLINFFSPGIDLYRSNLATSMLQITFPYLMMISLTSFIGAILNSCGKFGIPAFTPSLLNITLIITGLSLSNYFIIPIKSQAWGVLIAGFVQFAFQFIAIYRIGYTIIPVISFKHNGVKQVGKLLIPAIFGASINQVNILINTIIASSLATGSITWLYYSERLAYFPLGIFGVALTTALLPYLSSQHTKQLEKNFSISLWWGIKWNFIIGIPVSIVMIVLAEPLVTSLFYHGNFTKFDVLMTKSCVVNYAFGLQSFMLFKLFSSAFYVRKNIIVPVVISIISVITNIALSLILIKKMGHNGLALSTSFSSWIGTIIIFIICYKSKIIFINFHDIFIFILKLVLSNFLLFMLLYFSYKNIIFIENIESILRIFYLASLVLFSLFFYVICLIKMNLIPDNLSITKPHNNSFLS